MSHSAVLHGSGKYRYLPAISAYSSGVAAEAGYEILGLRAGTPLPLNEGFACLDRACSERGLPPDSVVAFELRSPAPFEFSGFDCFNDLFREYLKDRALLEGELNPIARTNVVPLHSPPLEPVLFAAYLLRPSTKTSGTDFVIAGGAELDGSLDPKNIIARGDTTPSGLRFKAAQVANEMQQRLTALEQSPASPTAVNVYTIHEIPGLTDLLIDTLPAVGQWGFSRWLAKPPVVELEFEMDLRRVSAWEMLS